MAAGAHALAAVSNFLAAAFSSREPVSTSLENALIVVNP
jgi:hypothetical protein